MMETATITFNERFMEGALALEVKGLTPHESAALWQELITNFNEVLGRREG